MIMKKLELTQMENVEGGKATTYCSQLGWWITHNYEGYQGDTNWLHYLYVTYCMADNA